MKKMFSKVDKVLLSIVIGVIFGAAVNSFCTPQLSGNIVRWLLNPLGNVFVRTLKVLVVPLTLCAVVKGAACIKTKLKLGRVLGKLLSYYVITTILGIAAALLAANLFMPGIGALLPPSAAYSTAEAPFVMDALVNMIPMNIIDALLKGNLVQIVAFALFFGFCSTLVGDSAASLISAFKHASHIMLKAAEVIMHAAPIGIFAIVAKTVISHGLDALLINMRYFVLCMVVLLFQVLLVHGAALKMIVGVNPAKLFIKCKDTLLVAFGTSSSYMAAPAAMNCCQNKLGISASLSGIAIPLGAGFNMNGTAIVQGIAVILVSQAYGIELGAIQQLFVVAAVMFAAIGSSNLPGASLAVLAVVLQQVGLPAEGTALVLAADRVLDMCKAVVNTVGDMAAATVVAASEKELNLEIYNERE